MEDKQCKLFRGCRPETEIKYRLALEMYTNSSLSMAEICLQCGITINGFSGYIGKYHRNLMLQRNGIRCNPNEAGNIKMRQRRGQHPRTHTKYKDAINACNSIDYISCNVSEIAREFGLNGTNLGRQLHVHYPEVLEFREMARERLGLDDGLPRGCRPMCKKQYAEAIELLQSDSYVTVQEAADRCNVSCTGLEQHLIFYHKDLVDKRISIRETATNRKRIGQITGRGTIHKPTKKITRKYEEALRLYKTTLLSARKIAMQTGVSIKGFYKYLHVWCKEEVCNRKGIPFDEDKTVDWSSVRKFNPATAVKYAEAIALLKEGGHTTAEVAARFKLHPECLRQYLKDHEPELHARLGMIKTVNGKVMARHSMDKYREALQIYATTTESIKSLAKRFGFNDSSFRQFIKRQFPELYKKHKNLVQQEKEKKKV